MKIDILILNYNGKPLLEANLPSVCEAARMSSHSCKVIVVDNCSNDGSVEFLKREFPEVITIVAKENRVLCSYNEVVRDLDSEIVIFLNNDMKADGYFIDPLSDRFEQKNVMFAAPRIMNPDNTFNGGKSCLKFKFGAISTPVDYDGYMERGSTQSISTGAFRRKMFLELGGFDDLFLPGIWEDVDICYRGQLRGWKGVYEPESLVWHDESTTFNKVYGEKRKMRIAHRNMFLFFWKNITDRRMFTVHIILTIPRLILQYILGKKEILEGFIMALRRMPMVLKKRKCLGAESSKKVLNDRSIIK